MDYIFQTGYAIFEQKFDFLFKLLNRPLRLGIACSGGPDSLLVLNYICKYKENNSHKIDFLLVIHIVDGHQLVEPILENTTNQARDLVVQQANNFLIEHIIYTNSNTDKFFEKLSIEATCHQIRKDFFRKAKEDFKLDRIITGHTLTDQLEHFFIGIIRNTSLRRISGMKEDSTTYYRPLLFMHKKNTASILDDIKQPYVMDPCNENNNYLRNKLRNTMLPLLNMIDDRFESSIIQLMNQINQREDLIDELVLNEYNKNTIFSNLSYFLGLHQVIQSKIIEKILYQLQYKKLVSLSLCSEIIRFLSTKKNQSHSINTIIINKKNNTWSIRLKN
jgi:tRNA(Ile)-lysidine synthase